MGNEVSIVPLADIVEIISGGTPKTNIAEYWGGEIPWLTVTDFNTGYRWVNSADKTITDLGVSNSATTILNQGDVIISARGTVGVIAQLARPMAFNQSCYGIRGKKGVSDTNFIYYALKNAVSQMLQVAYGGVFNTITRDTFKIIKTRLPHIKEQEAIACILGALDDKIEINRQMCKTLEDTAQAIFKSWFVDFDPVHAKAAGKQPERLKPEIAALFPDSFEDSELGKIPKGWRISPCLRHMNIISGGTPKTTKSEYWDGEIPWYSIGDAPLEHEVFVLRTEKKISQAGLENSSAKLLPVGATIISARGTVGKLALTGVPMAMNQSCYGLVSDSGSTIWNYLTISDAVATLKQRTHGSVFDTITRHV